MAMEFWVEQNQCWSDRYQGDWPECEDTEDFFEALCVFLRVCNEYLDECIDDDWDDGEWRNRVEDICKVQGKNAGESFADFLARSKTIESTGTVYVTLDSSDECILEFYADYDPDDGIWRASGLLVGAENVEIFIQEYHHLLSGISEKGVLKLKSLWRFNELSQ